MDLLREPVILNVTLKNGAVSMNKDQVKGRVEEAKGSVKQTVGRVTGNPDLEDRGTVDKVAGKIQKTFGDVKEQLKNADKPPR